MSFNVTNNIFCTKIKKKKRKTRNATTCTHEPQISDYETLISNHAFRILLERTSENTGILSRETKNIESKWLPENNGENRKKRRSRDERKIKASRY